MSMAQLVEYLPMYQKVAGLIPDYTHTWVACLILNQVCKGGNRSMFFPLSLFLPLPFFKTKQRNKQQNIKNRINLFVLLSSYFPLLLRASESLKLAQSFSTGEDFAYTSFLRKIVQVTIGGGVLILASDT